MFTSLFNDEDGEEKREQVRADRINLFMVNFCSVLLAEHQNCLTVLCRNKYNLVE